MSLPGSRYWLYPTGELRHTLTERWLVYDVVDLTRVPAGWHRATAEGRRRAVVLRGSYERCVLLRWPRR